MNDISVYAHHDRRSFEANLLEVIEAHYYQGLDADKPSKLVGQLESHHMKNRQAKTKGFFASQRPRAQRTP